MERVEDRQLKIRFEAGTSRKLQWKFKPQQKEVKVCWIRVFSRFFLNCTLWFFVLSLLTMYVS